MKMSILSLPITTAPAVAAKGHQTEEWDVATTLVDLKAQKPQKHPKTFFAEPAKVMRACTGPAQRDFAKPVVNEAKMLGIPAVQISNDYMDLKKLQTINEESVSVNMTVKFLQLF